MKFKELLKRTEILTALSEMQYETPTEIQEKIMPSIIVGKDVLGQSQTGTGKTLAFAGPILDTILENKQTQTLVLAPTRELAIQIAKEMNQYAKYTKFNITCVYGSSSIEEQIRNLNKGAEIVIGTPGRVRDLILRRKLKLDHIKYFVLDEADEMLSMGFQEEIEHIFESIQTEKQVLLFSATMPKKILDIGKKYMKPNYETVSIVSNIKVANNITQNYYVIPNLFRTEALARIVDYYHVNKAILFVRTRKNADELLEKLLSKGYNAGVIHGDITQERRIKTLELFKLGLIHYLIATDIAARGIHVDDVELVVNYNLPESHESYVHRIGRTGRANKSGISVTLITDREEYIIKDLERFTKSTITRKKLPKMEQILPNRMEQLIEEIEEYREKPCEVLHDSLNNLSEKELKNIIANLLQEKLDEHLGSDFTITIPEGSKPKQKRHNPESSIRVFMTIGKKDNIQKKEFLEWIEKKANIGKGACTGIEIMPTFTFLNIQMDSYDKVIKHCHNSTYKKRVIRIEKAKK